MIGKTRSKKIIEKQYIMAKMKKQIFVVWMKNVYFLLISSFGITIKEHEVIYKWYLTLRLGWVS